MSAVRVLLASTQEDLLPSGLALAVSQMPEVELVTGGVVDATAVERNLDLNADMDAIILAGDEQWLDRLSDRLLQNSSKLAVVRVTFAPSSLRVNLSIRQVGISELVEMIGAMARRSGATVRGRINHCQLVTTEEPAHRASRSSFFAAACEWLDAVLSQALLRNEGRRSGDLPGLTIGYDTIANLLSPQVPATEDATTAKAWRSVEEILAGDSEDERFIRLIRRLGLVPLECKVLLLCLASELDIRYQRIFGYLHDDLSRRRASLGLIFGLLGQPVTVRRELALTAGLYRWRLIEAPSSDDWAADEAARVDAAVISWLFDNRTLFAADPRLQRLVRSVPWPVSCPTTPEDANRKRLADCLNANRPDERFILTGSNANVWRTHLEAIATEDELQLLRIDVQGLADLPRLDLVEVAQRLARATRLLDALPVIDTTFGLVDLIPVIADVVVPPLAAATDRPLAIILNEPGQGAALIAGYSATILQQRPLDIAARAKLFREAAEGAGITLSPDQTDDLATAYDLTTPAEAVALAKALARGETPPRTAGHAGLAAACRRLASPDLPRFARRLDPCFELSQVVLPADRHRQLNEIVDQMLHAHQVLDTWGFAAQLPYGRGVAALFSGPSGTGKTMAAQAIARELKTEVFAVDLSRVVSKYIGDTEKNLDAVFNETERSGAVLLFDEADALFGKRGEVKDSHDRYANIEVAYLLQRMEMFNGLAILTTNLRQNLDPAFLRRLRFLIEFPKPDTEAREKIWRLSLQGAPTAEGIDLRFLARRLELTGGNIRQAVLRAAFAAAAESAGQIAMRHLVEATRAELLKLGMPSVERELADWAA